MRCQQFYVNGEKTDTLQQYYEVDGNNVPVTEYNLQELGILIRVDAIADEGKIITASHGELINGKWVEIIDEQLSDTEIDIQRQDTKSLKLKQAENAFLMLVASVPGVVAGDNSDALTAKIEAAENLSDNQKTALGLKLLNAIHEVELQGGSWYDLPSTLHNLE